MASHSTPSVHVSGSGVRGARRWIGTLTQILLILLLALPSFKFATLANAIAASFMKLDDTYNATATTSHATELSSSLWPPAAGGKAIRADEPIRDWFDEDRWKQGESQFKCFYVEDICHGAHSFFYDKSRRQSAKQPSWKIVRTDKEGEYWDPGYPLDIFVEKDLDQSSCHNRYYSPIKNHLVLHGMHAMALGNSMPEYWSDSTD